MGRITTLLRDTLIVVLVSCIGFLPMVALEAAAAPTTLDSEVLRGPVDSLRVNGTCNQVGPSAFTFSVGTPGLIAGLAQGPVAGYFSEEGTFTLASPNGPVTSFTASFTIRQGSPVNPPDAVGTKTLMGQARGGCVQTGGQLTGLTISGTTNYSVTSPFVETVTAPLRVGLGVDIFLEGPFRVGQAATTITTQASPSVTVGGAISDGATLAGGMRPTGSITFTLFGPDDATCTGAVAFSSNKTVSGYSAYASDPFTAQAVGVYRWVASYSGDANNTSTTTACNDPNESVIVSAPPPSVAPVLVSSPTSMTVVEGGAALFGAAALGTPVPTVQWQVSIDGGATFTDMAGYVGTNLTFTAVASQTNNLYRAVFSNVAGSITTTAARLVVESAHLSASANPVAVTGDGLSAATVTATLVDQLRNPLVGRNITLTWPLSGDVEHGVTDQNGHAMFSVSDGIQEVLTFVVSYRNAANILVTAPVTVTFLGPSGLSTVVATPSSVTADGLASSRITVALIDSNGNPVRARTIYLTTSTSIPASPLTRVTPTFAGVDMAGRAESLPPTKSQRR
jgi:hypothetical protein